MLDTTLDGTYVTLCDWHGRVIWLSGTKGRLKIGDYVWQYVAQEQQEHVKTAVSRVATLGELLNINCDNQDGEHIKSWLWPLLSPEMAICVLSIIMPKELFSLSKREMETLGLLALGHDTKEIAEELGVSVSTVHTHLKRSKEKTGTRNMESLAAFAARYCYPRLGASDRDQR